MVFITYDQAVHHLKQDGVLDGPPEDTDLALKVDQANGVATLAAKWDETTMAPDGPEFAVVQALTLRVLAWLYRNRGDDEPTKDMSVEQIFVASGVYLVRVPTLA